MNVSKKMVIGILYLICILSCGLAELPSLGESNRELKPQRESQYDLDLWNSYKTFNKDRYYQDEDRSDRNYLHLNKYRAVISEPEMGVFRTRGKGKATVLRRGETVYVPNELPRKGVGISQKYKGSISVRVVDKNDNEVRSSRHRGGCRECPSDQTVIAAKGNSFVILPEPCPLAPRMWNHHSGPTPGSKIEEGVHTIRGSIGPKKRFCEYRYQVLVNRCDPLEPKEDTVLECSAENVWGSICIVSCGFDKEALGPTEMECKENLTWSNPLPTCKSKRDCLPPKVKTKSKLSCQTANSSYTDNSYFPNGSTCKFRQNGQTISITCKEGRWLKSRKTALSKQNKESMKKKTSKSDDCEPNPCQNGGTCLKSESNKGSPICKCRPQTQGVHCELRECYYNICENDGLCIYQNEERMCYCSSYYGGDRCQNYLP